MNFSPFGGHFSTSIPTIHQFAAKFQHETNGSSSALCPPPQENSNRYTANGVPSFTQHHPATPSQQHMVNSKYQQNYLNQTYSGQQQQNNVRQQEVKRYEQQELAQEICAAMLQQNQQQQPQQQQSPAQEKQTNEKKQEIQEERNRNQQHSQPQQQHQQQPHQNQIITSSTPMPTTWQSLAAPGSTVADYLSHLPASTLPLSLHHFLKYSAETIKKETNQQPQLNIPNNDNLNLLHVNSLPTNLNTINTSSNNLLGGNALNTLTTINTSQIQTSVTGAKKKKKKKVEKEKKPRPKPGEIRLTTALDGSTLYCCPECHMAYPEKELLEQHLVGHTLERRFVCDICGAGLKRKDHLTRHKQSHNPERPYVCTVCLKAFKRKEQLTLHFVIHSGEKRHICTECGKGFYRKDHLRKHTRSHIARRVKAELSQQGSSNTPTLQLQVSAPTSTSTTNPSVFLEAFQLKSRLI